MKQARIYRRAYTAFQLRDLSNEVPLSTISTRYKIPPRHSPDPGAAVPRLRCWDRQILPAHELGHARRRAGPHA